MTTTWTTRGFEKFRQGQFGNAGQNLYVSRAGVLQRIHQYDLNGNGYLDLVFCNSQNHQERPPAFVYDDPLGAGHPTELPAEGAWTGAVADLNNDGFDDLILGMRHNGIRPDLNATVYYGAPDGMSERRQQQLPVPECESVAAGDFDGNGRPALAFASQGALRIFSQSDLGFEPQKFVDLDIAAEQLTAGDLDGDGFDDLVVRSVEGGVTVYWGGADGINPDRATVFFEPDTERARPSESAVQYAEHVEEAMPLAGIVHLNGRPHLFLPRSQSVSLAPVGKDRRLGPPLELFCSHAMAVAVGDVNGDGYDDLVFACREALDEGERSWIYWGGPEGFDETRRTPLNSYRACDVAVAELSGGGCADVILCQTHTPDSYSADSLIYRASRTGIDPEPVRLPCQDARRVLLARAGSNARPHVIFVNHFGRNRLGNISPYIYFGSADGFFSEKRQELPGWGAVEALCCDFNDDGFVDVVLANASENSVDRDPGSYLLLNGPDGFDEKPTWILPTNRAHGVCAADINRDGHLDLIFCGFDNPELLIFYGVAADTATGLCFDTASPQRIRLEHDGKLYNEPRWIYLADLNNNGWLDLVVPQIAYDRSFILWGGPQGFSMDRCQPLSVVRGACARAADLNGNGYLDLIIGGHITSEDGPHDSFAYIYWNGPDGLREDRRTLLPASAINAMAVADFNNDGQLDLFICSYHNGRERDIDSFLYWNRAGRGFSANDRTRLFTHSASGCVAADFNGNGWIDLAVANHKVEGDHVGYSAVWWNGPEGFSAERITRLPTSGPHGMTAVSPHSIDARGPEEYYLSTPCKLPDGARATEISWEAETPSRTWVKAQLRFGGTEEELEEAAWQGPDGDATWFERPQPVGALSQTGQWVQYKLALGARNACGTPRVTAVDVLYELSAQL
ncbi:MAG: FG-GAP-like repeat-containing protein [Caldilineaceae bacterium]|nr:FG-GAP-like repeat-containing protein [Caldilineaceae bacterium]